MGLRFTGYYVNFACILSPVLQNVTIELEK
jgi:hypothetical protein